MIGLIVTGIKKEFIAVKGRKVKKDFGPGTLEAGIMFKKDDIFYKTIDFEEYISTLDWELIQEDDYYIIHEGSCWMFKEKKSKLGSIAAAIFEDENLVKNLF